MFALQFEPLSVISIDGTSSYLSFHSMCFLIFIDCVFLGVMLQCAFDAICVFFSNKYIIDECHQL